MAIIKCKMCGGDLNIIEGSTVAECEYCGTKQTVPSADNEKKLTLFARAGRLLRACEFDKAAGVFESIVADFPEEAEAYWGLVLCKYGIEYVDDPATGKKIPTCHRSSFDSVLDDPNFEQACENTDAVARRVYRDEARQIEDLRQAILQVSGKEEPYDVFISYKETDENGDRTLDSVIAQDIYKELTGEGYRVFFSRISLEDKLGTEYEPYIFAALNSAKVMLVVGTDYENFESVWVKNEWSRFLKLIAAGQKKTLIPVFKNMDAYDMPKEFAKLAAQDMGKVGAMQDLVRGVEKIVGKKKPETVKETVVVQQGGGPNVAALLKRGQQALEDRNWNKATEFYNRVLDADAENAEAFFGLFLSEAKCAQEREYIAAAASIKGKTEQLTLPPDSEHIEAVVKGNELPNFLSADEIRACFNFDLDYPSAVKDQAIIASQEQAKYSYNRNMSRATRFAKGETAERLNRFKTQLYDALDQNVAQAREAEKSARKAKAEAYARHLDAADHKVVELRKNAEEKRETDYQGILRQLERAKDRFEYDNLKNKAQKLIPYKDCEEIVKRCQESVDSLRKAEVEKAEQQRLHAEKAEKAHREKQKKFGVFAGVVGVLMIVALVIFARIIRPANQYDAAEELLANGDKPHAAMAFYALGGYKDARERSFAIWDQIAQRNTIATGTAHTVGLKTDGTVIAVGNNDNGQCNVSDWNGIVAITSGGSTTLGLRADGTVVAAGNSDDGETDISDWKDIVAIDSYHGHTVGLKADGTVIAVGYNGNGQCDVSTWNDIVAISTSRDHTVGLRADGTVVATRYTGKRIGSWGTRYYHDQCEVSEWKDIVAVAAGDEHTIGLKADGTVIAVGDNESGECNVSGWKDIVAIDADLMQTIGISENGRVVAVGYDGNGELNVSSWRDIIAISIGGSHTVGIKEDGTVVATEFIPSQYTEYEGQCDVSDWKNIKLPNT